VGRKLYQPLAALLGWAAFGLLWWLAFRHLGPAWQMLTGLLLAAAFTVFLAIVTGAWIAWNVFLWRRDGPKPVRLPHPYDYSRDSVGRQVRTDFSSLRGSRFIVVDVTGGADDPGKIYTPGDEEVTGEEAMVCAL
jgi:hypothetical protein